jgi:hypothetical protein
MPRASVMATKLRPFSMISVLTLLLTGQASSDLQSEFCVETRSYERFLGFRMHVWIMHADAHAEPLVSLYVGGVDAQGDTLELAARSDASFLRTGKLKAVFSSELDRAGTFWMTRRTVDGAPSAQVSDGSRIASGAELQIQVRDRTVEGFASGMEATLAGWFEGPFSVGCSVPAVPLARSAPVAPGELPAQEPDPEFRSALCAPWRDWKERAAPPPPRLPGQCDG